MKSIIQILVNQPENFTPTLAKSGIKELFKPETTPAQISAFLIALKLQNKDSNAEIVAACATTMLEFALTIDFSEYKGLQDSLVDIVGTGGDGMNTFNVSTTAGIVAAGAGCKIAKFGNRASSSKSGSADILESLGCAISSLTPSEAPHIINKSNFCFLFAPVFHPALKNVAGPRREIGVSTIFNLLGPLLNPAQPKRVVIGVHSKNIGALVAESLRLRGATKAMVVHGIIGLDEISPEGETCVWELSQSKITEYVVSPADFGLPNHPIISVVGGTSEENAAILGKLLEGNSEGPILDFVLLNAAAVLVVADKARDFKEGVKLARESIKSGRALAALTDFRKALDRA
ncbi:5037_t:CDS:2 [Ambispora gerdemannii]|uniref:Anthranilate phosphoribosyltransferase n=1 Tax=Ambispora gerdemannii TaxID=144530 RepID=A0A9N9FZQ6_9GLOM|nr:5037_t:CDS:2 [Ambispora gerdemannii]